MNDAYNTRLRRLDPYAELWRDDKKFVEHRVGLYATLYFKHVDPSVDSNAKIREALIECWDDYWRFVGTAHQRWAYRFGSGVHAHRLPSAKVRPIGQLLRDPECFGSYQYYVHGGKHEDDASDYLYSLAAFPIYGAPEFPNDLGYLRLQAPLSTIAAGRLAAFSAMVRRCAERIGVHQGHGGLGLLRTYNEERTTRMTEAQIARVFSGVDIDVPYVQMGRLFNPESGPTGIDGPHWINFLDNEWVARLGGLARLQQLLPSELFTVESYEGGAYIQAGPHPEPGHRDDGPPLAYVWLNRVLRPIRAPDMAYCMGNDPALLGLKQGGPGYFARFDDASDRLDALDTVGAPTDTRPTGREVADQLRVGAGESCPRTGFWFSPARADSRRRFDAGETMPSLGGDYGITIWQWDMRQE